MDVNIHNRYQEYEERFANNSLEAIVAAVYAPNERTDLSSLYDYGMVPFQILRQKLGITDTGRVVKCQNCTINDSNTFDHLIPQSEFIEYTIHPKNLMCSCSDCNGRKGAIWRNYTGKRTSLNLYLDQLPEAQYLFVNVDVGNIRTDVSFYLDNPGGIIDEDLFTLLKSHYTKLNLCQRFAEGSDTVITSFKTILEPLRIVPDVEMRKSIVNESIRKEKIAFGFNYWQSVLKSKLIDDPDFTIDFF